MYVIPQSEKFGNGFSLAIGENGIFGQDLVRRIENFAKFGLHLILRSNILNLAWI